MLHGGQFGRLRPGEIEGGGQPGAAVEAGCAPAVLCPGLSGVVQVPAQAAFRGPILERGPQPGPVLEQRLVGQLDRHGTAARVEPARAARLARAWVRVSITWSGGGANGDQAVLDQLPQRGHRLELGQRPPAGGQLPVHSRGQGQNDLDRLFAVRFGGQSGQRALAERRDRAVDTAAGAVPLDGQRHPAASGPRRAQGHRQLGQRAGATRRIRHQQVGQTVRKGHSGGLGRQLDRPA